MLAFILVSILITILILIISLALYFITLICEGSDDSEPDSLGIETSGFSTTPATSPLAPTNDHSINETALHVAIRRRKLPTLIELLIHGARVEVTNDKGETPLFLACKLNDLHACQLLLVFDADVDTTDKSGISVRHYVASICSRDDKRHQPPRASHLILAMLDEMGAKRCPKDRGSRLAATLRASASDPTLPQSKCPEGCSHSGSYKGESFNRWPDFVKESLYKRYMFADIIGDLERLENYEDVKRAEGRQYSRLLCIDGGGMRGVIVCQIMIELEKYLERPLISYFDWIGGTSVGAFVSCALCNGTTLQELRRISFDVKDEVFSGNKPYNSKFLERVLKRTFGSETRMSDVTDKKLAVTTVIADRDPCQLRLFRNYLSPSDILEQYGYSADMYDLTSGHSIVAGKMVSPSMLDENSKNPLLWHTVRASGAAPFFFEPFGPYLDGGIISNNPTMDMMSEFFARERVKAFLLKRVEDREDGAAIAVRKFLTDKLTFHQDPPSNLELVLSLGTGRGRVVGQQAMMKFGNVATGLATVFSPGELLRSIRAARDLFKKLMHRSCMTDDHVLDRAQAWCSSLGIPYFRINPPLANIFSIDDKRDEQLINALWQTKLYMRSMRPQLKQLARLLDKR